MHRLTGAAWSFASLLVTRLLFGIGEAGAFPNISRSFSAWIPADERGSAHGLVIMGTRAGGALTPPLMVALMAWLGWRVSFVALGVLGLAWAVLWLKWFTDDPADHPSVNAAELAEIRRGCASAAAPAVAWRELVSANLLFICLMYFCGAYALYFNLTWLPLYLREARGFTAQQAAFGSGMVLMGGALGTWQVDA